MSFIVRGEERELISNNTCNKLKRERGGMIKMYKNKSSLAKCAKDEAALARSPEKTGLFLLISELHIWRLGTLFKR